MNLTSVKGVSETKKDRLEGIGIKFAEDLAQANAARVDQLSNCSPQLVANAQRYLTEEVGTNLGDGMNYYCEDCGMHFELSRDALEKHRMFSKCQDKESMGGYF